VIWGVVVLEPTTTITNLILAAECWVLFRLLRPGGIPRPIPDQWGSGTSAGLSEVQTSAAEGAFPVLEPRPPSDPSHSWSGFFFFLGFATLLGAAKDGFPHYLEGLPLYFTVFGSSLASGLGVLHAEAAAVRRHVQSRSLSRRLRLLSLGKFTVLGVAIALHDSIGFVIANTALGLVPIMVVEYRAFRRGHGASAWIAGGIAVSSLAAFAYILEVPSYPWFDHRDLPHVLMMATLVMIFRGVGPRPSGGPRP
jgi:hypothetical protein